MERTDPSNHYLPSASRIFAGHPHKMIQFIKKFKKMFAFSRESVIIIFTGVWRSLVARTAGGREVAGSNPVAPIFQIQKDIDICLVFRRRL